MWFCLHNWSSILIRTFWTLSLIPFHWRNKGKGVSRSAIIIPIRCPNFSYHCMDCGSKAFIRVCLSVCLFVRTTEFQNGWNYNHQTCHRNSPSWVLATHLIFGQNFKGQGHRVIKCKNIFQAIECMGGVSLHSIECSASCYIMLHT